jgi:hypothetical protein
MKGGWEEGWMDGWMPLEEHWDSRGVICQETRVYLPSKDMISI